MSKRLATVCAVVTLAIGASARAGGVGVLGDSYSDEYQFYAPHRNAARNWVEILAKCRGVDFGEFGTETRGEPRNQGYAYNWARSGATAASMIASGQHTGLAEQVARGDVDAVVIFVGGNDFIEAVRSNDPTAALRGLGPRAASDVKTAADAILGASAGVRLLIATVPDVRDLPEFRDDAGNLNLDPEVASLVVAEVEAFNAEVRRIADVPGSRVGVFDFARISRVSRLLAPRFVTVAGRRVERHRAGDAPEHLFLADRRHLGTMGQGMMAKFLADALNRKCGAAIKPLGEREIADLADAVGPVGIASSTSGDETPRGQD